MINLGDRHPKSCLLPLCSKIIIIGRAINQIIHVILVSSHFIWILDTFQMMKNIFRLKRCRYWRYLFCVLLFVHIFFVVFPPLTKPHYGGHSRSAQLSLDYFSSTSRYRFTEPATPTPCGCSRLPLPCQIWYLILTFNRQRPEGTENCIKPASIQSVSSSFHDAGVGEFRSMWILNYHRHMPWDIHLKLVRSSNILHWAKRRHRDSNPRLSDALALDTPNRSIGPVLMYFY